MACAKFAGVPRNEVRGGLRVIYYWDNVSATFYMLFLYQKNEQADLSAAQIRTIARLVREEFR